MKPSLPQKHTLQLRSLRKPVNMGACCANQKHWGKPLLFHDKCSWFFYTHYFNNLVHWTYDLTSHPKDEAIMVKCLAQGHKHRDQPGLAGLAVLSPNTVNHLTPTTQDMLKNQQGQRILPFSKDAFSFSSWTPIAPISSVTMETCIEKLYWVLSNWEMIFVLCKWPYNGHSVVSWLVYEYSCNWVNKIKVTLHSFLPVKIFIVLACLHIHHLQLRTA